MAANISKQDESVNSVISGLPRIGAIAYPRSFAFFDLDRTLFVGHTLSLCVHHFMKKRRYNIVEYLGLGIISGLIPLAFQILHVPDRMRNRLLTIDASLAQELSETWFREHLEPAISLLAKQRLKEHQERGEQVILLTASTQFIAAIVSGKMGIQYCCTQLRQVNEEITCATNGPVCYGEDKLIYAKKIASAWRVPLETCSFYTDSYSDHSLLDHVGKPVAVNPDRRLQEVARKRGWEVLAWS